jgi:ABC-type Zn2+ transport system substrate-binding protein/surface adhesin
MPIVNRSNENRDREKYYNKSIEILSLVYSKTAELNNSQPWVQDKIEAHLKKINDTVEYIYNKVKQQFERKPNQDVTFYVFVYLYRTIK